MVEGKCTDSDEVEETYYSGNIGQWMGGSMEEITGGVSEIELYGDNFVRDAARAADRNY